MTYSMNFNIEINTCDVKTPPDWSDVLDCQESYLILIILS